MVNLQVSPGPLAAVETDIRARAWRAKCWCMLVHACDGLAILMTPYVWARARSKMGCCNLERRGFTLLRKVLNIF